MVENIKEGKNLKNYAIIDFSSLKKYTTESSRPLPSSHQRCHSSAIDSH